jgi:hypothetical protein
MWLTIAKRNAGNLGESEEEESRVNICTLGSELPVLGEGFEWWLGRTPRTYHFSHCA